ncbi:hypothetical protein [Fusobacterium ulcerans]|uniref:hypothetical protein n=1 Tax=Fusobacterium ulcerans TaxID=861 RepID=UPI003FEE4617
MKVKTLIAHLKKCNQSADVEILMMIDNEIDAYDPTYHRLDNIKSGVKKVFLESRSLWVNLQK